MNVTINDNSEEVLSRLARAKKRGLKAIGLAAEGYAKKIITQEHRVDTGRMRNSVTHVEDDDATYVGTNVSYAIFNEEGTFRMRGIHFLRRAATEHTAEYRKLMEKSYRNG